MNIAIISDTHDRLELLEKCLDYIKKEHIPVLIHCGDFARGEVLDFIGKGFNGKVYAVAGNAEIDVDELERIAAIYPDVSFEREFGQVTVEGTRVAYCHKPYKARELAKIGEYDLIFHGDSHKPWQEFVNGTEILNPGNMSDAPFPSTFAVYDTQSRKARLIQLPQI